MTPPETLCEMCIEGPNLPEEIMMEQLYHYTKAKQKLSL